MAKKKQTPTPPAPKKDKKGKDAKEGQGKDTKERKPARNGRVIVAQSTSWTGKLPSSLLHEHCQKQNWNKVDYEMKKLPEGFLAVPVLSWKNPKTSETITVKYHPPKEIVKPQETSLEARHYAATYALHRLAYHKNIHMVLPSNHKHLWSDLEIERKRITKENPYRAKLEYTAEPFSAVLERRKEEEALQKQRDVKTAAMQKEKKPTIIIGNNTSGKDKNIGTNGKANNYTPKKASNYNRDTVSSFQKTSFPNKVWNSAAMIDLDAELRTNIENAIKNHIDWSEEEVKFTNPDVSYAESLERLGFRRVHVDEALKYTNTFNDTLEWLVFHLPEDDLPSAFAKNESETGTKLTVMKNISLERNISKLSKGGYSRTESKDALFTNANDLVSAAVYLTNKNAVSIDLTEADKEKCTEDSFNDWLEEKSSLKIIYDSRIIDDDPAKDDVYEVALNPDGLENEVLSLVVYRSPCYPFDICGLFLVVKNESYSLPNYIKVNIISNLICFLIENSMLGMPYIYSCIDWLEQNIMKIIQNPGPLYDATKYRKNNGESLFFDSGKRQSKNKADSVTKSRLNVKEIEASYNQRQKSSEIKQTLTSRAKLPAWQKKTDLVNMINSNKVSLVTGETGSGKSTQIVQFILDDLNAKGDFETTIICTQPRRISAIGLAERISTERVDNCGSETGYIIRGENKTGNKTRLSFVTTGVLLRLIQTIFTKNANDDSFFRNLGYIFIDEVHERSIDSDFLLIILKQIVLKFPKLKVVLMSATIDVSIFNGYFSNSDIAHVHISGRTYPIEDHYLDDILELTNYSFVNNQNEIIKPSAKSKFFQEGNINYELLALLVNKVDESLTKEGNTGSILIFLPGVLEVKKSLHALDDNRYWALPLHSALSSQDQKRIFKKPPTGQRKIIAATNIAETSITISDAVVVIDTGRVKSVQYDHKANSTKLVEVWASQAEVAQRRGRAGRVQNGICYKLYTKETQLSMLPQPVPEIKRTKLESVYLVVKAMGIKDVYKFLQNGLDPPAAQNVENAKRVLAQVGALHNDEMTCLGTYLSLLPTDLNSGKMLIFGAMFGCLESCLTLAAISVSGNPFIIKQEERDAVKSVQMRLANGNGDMISILNAFKEYSTLRGAARRRYLNDNYLSPLRMNDIDSTRSQYLNNLKDIGFVPLTYNENDDLYNRNNENYPVLRAILTSASYPNTARIEFPDTKYLQTISGAVELDPDVKKIKYWIRNEGYLKDSSQLPSVRAFIHPSSTLFDANESSSPVKFVSFSTSQETTKLYLRDITPTSTLSVLLFGGTISYDISSKSRGIIMDDWLPIRTWSKNAVLLTKLRLLLDQTMRVRLESPNSTVGNDVLSIVEKLIRNNI